MTAGRLSTRVNAICCRLFFRLRAEVETDVQNNLIVALLGLMLLFGMSTSRAADADADAVDAAKSYIERLKAGDVKQSVIACWDADALLAGAFGLMYFDLPVNERKRAQSAFAGFVAAPFANPRVSELFKGVEVQEAIPTQISPSTVSVRLQLIGDGGKFRVVNTMLLVKTDAGWRITDQRQGDAQPSIRAALVMTYVGAAKGAADTLPVVLERVAAETRKQMSGS